MQSREAETGQTMGAPLPEACGFRGRPADPKGRLTSSIHVVASRSSGSLTTVRAALRRSMPAPAGTMPPLHPTVKPNPLQKANLCSCLLSGERPPAMMITRQSWRPAARA